MFFSKMALSLSLFKKRQTYVYVILAIILIIFLFNRAKKGGDFDVFLYAGSRLLEGGNIYQPPFIKGLQYFYSPLFALLLAPFSLIPYVITEFFWLLLNIFFVYRLIVIFRMLLNLKILGYTNLNILWVASTIFLVRYIEYNVGMIQITIFLLWVCWEFINSMKNNKNIVFWSAMLALAINIKLMLLPLIPYVLYRNKIKHFFLVVGFCFFYLFIPSLFLGIERNNFLLSEWWKVINPANKEHTIEEKNGSVSLSALVPVFITNTNGDLPIKRNFISLTPQEASMILNIIRIAFVVLTLFFLGTYPFRESYSDIHIFREVSYICLIIPLIYPHQQKYAFIFLTPAIVYTIYSFILEYKHKLWNIKTPIFYSIVSCWFFIMVVFSFSGRGIVGSQLHELFAHYRLITFCAILMIIPLFIFSPCRINFNH